MASTLLRHRRQIEQLVAGAESSPVALFEKAQRLEQTLCEHYRERYRSAPPEGDYGQGTGDLQAWVQEAEYFAQHMAATRVPITSGARARQQAEFSARLRGLRAAKSMAEQRSLVRLFEQSRSAAESSTRRHVAIALAPELQRVARRGVHDLLPPVMGTLADAAVAARPPVPGIGRLRVRAGFGYQEEWRVFQRRPGTGLHDVSYEYVGVPVMEAPHLSPFVLDLDQQGGLVTDSLDTVNAVVLKLLALLPAGQLKAMVFDPLKLGDSAKFLYGLGDAAAGVIGDKVRSTERELNDLLTELEEHITFVTQKYLQGQYESLTDFNRAAGEVAEPYRLLVLYDFPAGFTRPGGGKDEDALARLAKIVQSGRRTGVFPLMVTTSPVEDAALGGIPWLFDGIRSPDEWTAWLAAGIPSDPTFDTGAPPEGNPTALRHSLTVPGANTVFTYPGSYTAWFWTPEPPPSPQVVASLLAGVERGLTSAKDVRVTAEQVATLAANKQRRARERGVAVGEAFSDPARPDTWWRASSAEEIVGTFGRVGASDVASLVLDSKISSGALIGGRPGSGKSVLIHALIDALTRTYGPDELELYLVDFKEGVEFQAYATAGLPHARVVAVESERDFGLSVLQSLDAEISRRGSLFRGRGGEELNLAGYRAQSGQPLPRVVLLVDEFHVLFEREDKIANRAAELLDRVVRQGRAFGVHAILASQTLSGTAGLGKHTLNQIPLRIALQSSEADSRLLLADDNTDARLLSRPGEGILNTKAGLKDANKRFQAAFTAPEDRSERVAALRRMADQRGFTRRPVVFQGRALAETAEVDAALFRSAATTTSLDIPVGLPATLDGPVTASLRREPGGNLLMVLPDEDLQAATAVALTALAASGVRCDHVNFGSLEDSRDQLWSALQAAGTTTHRGRQAPVLLERTASLVRERLSLGEHREAPYVLVLSSLHRARDLDPNSGAPEVDLLEEIVRDGPDVGVFVVASVDKPISAERRLSRAALREFGVRLVGPMSKEDSFSLIDSDTAAGLRPSEGVLDDHDRGVATRVRRFAEPTATWVSGVLGLR